MKAKTQIEQAVKAAYEIYAEYAREKHGVVVKAAFPVVTWERGSLKNPNTGWVIDGTLYPGSAEQVIRQWQRIRVKYERLLWQARGVSPEQMPLPEEASEPAQDGQ